ncbi:MAG: hypothetical protein JWO94_294 [Verrucomicrobiaceae bacterium]|nr:hypothetical protein [Verrucomicrobiaceae bacterium]
MMLVGRKRNSSSRNLKCSKGDSEDPISHFKSANKHQSSLKVFGLPKGQQAYKSNHALKLHKPPNHHISLRIKSVLRGICPIE